MRMMTLKIFAAAIFFSLGALISLPAQAACSPSADFVARDSNGQFIPSVKVEVYEQITNANGDAAAGSRLAYGTTSSSSGKATLKFSEKEKYAVKMATISNDNAAFWYYDVIFTCDAVGSFERVLSAIDLTIYDGDGELVKDNSVKVYTQVQSGGSAVEATDELVASLETDSSGRLVAYLPQASVRGIAGNGDVYALMISRGTKTFPVYGVAAKDGYTTVTGYYLSTLKAYFRDSSTGGYLSDGTEVKVYEQGIDNENDHQKGDYVGSFKVGNSGYGLFEYPAGVYVLELKGNDGTYQYFWDTEIEPGRTTEYDFDVSSNIDTESSCSEYSTLALYFKTISGTAIADLKYELYEQSADSLTGYPVAGEKVSSGSTNDSGYASKKFKPDSRIYYALKVYEKKSDVGESWFWNAVHFDCGEDRSVTKLIPALNIVLRDPSGNLKRNFSFNLYQEQYDADGSPIRTSSSLVSSLKTSDSGSVSLFVAPDHLYLPGKKGNYLISDSKGSYVISGLRVQEGKDTLFDYRFAGLNLQATASKQPLSSRDITIYSQDGNKAGKALLSSSIDSSGSLSLEYPAGTYAVSVEDSFGQPDLFYGIKLDSGVWSNANLALGTATISSSFSDSDKSSRKVNIAAMAQNSDGTFSPGQVIGSVSVAKGKVSVIDLAAGPYLFSYISASGAVYGQAAVISQGQNKAVDIAIANSMLITNKNKFSLSYSGGSYNVPASQYFASRLKGYILLQVESHGEAWYVDPATLSRTYMKDGAAAFSIMQKSGVGASNLSLGKIPVGLDSRLGGTDSDGDLLPDKLEQALGTDPKKKDADGDGYDDYLEIKNEYNPIGSGRQGTDAAFAKSQAGRILLQVEGKGEAWYINPKDNKRYYLADGETAFQVMKYLGLGISDKDLKEITEKK